MTEPDRYGEEIRRALNAAAELVVPAGDGLDIIRKRAARRPPAFAWLLAYVSYLPRQLATRVRVMGSELALMARRESDLPHRALARLRPQSGRQRSAQAWLRPALAAAAALFLVLGVTLAVPRLRATVTNSANGSPPGGAPGGSSGQAYGHGSRSPGASGTASVIGSRGPGPAMNSDRGTQGISLYLLPPVMGSPSPTSCPSSAPGTSTGPVPPANPDPSATPSGGGGGPEDPAAAQCTPGSSTTPTPPPTSTSPVPPTSTPPTTPPTSTPPTTSPPPTSSSPTAGSTSGSTPTESPAPSSS